MLRPDIEAVARFVFRALLTMPDAVAHVVAAGVVTPRISAVAI